MSSPYRPPVITYEVWVERMRDILPDTVTDAQLRTVWKSVRQAGEELRLATTPSGNQHNYLDPRCNTHMPDDRSADVDCPVCSPVDNVAPAPSENDDYRAGIT